MFLLIPLLTILVSVLAIGVIIWRKKPYLKEMISTGGSSSDFNLASNFSLLDYGVEFLPELSELIKKFKINKYKNIGLVEAEKFLRKARLIFLKIDWLSDTWIKKIRKIHLNGELNTHMAEDKLHEAKPPVSNSPSVGDKETYGSKTVSPNFLKNEEQRLIIEIAKNPKDARLYELLGDLYLEMENFADAKESYEAAGELNPQNETVKEKLSSAIGRINHN